MPSNYFSLFIELFYHVLYNFKSLTILPNENSNFNHRFHIPNQKEKRSPILNKYLLFRSAFSSSTLHNFHHQLVYLHSYFTRNDNMATSTSKETCLLCNKNRGTYICEGCSKRFCIDHLLEHRTNIREQFDQLQNDHDQLRQQINDFKIDSTKHPLTKQIDRWEVESINKIKQHAQRCRMQWINYSTKFSAKIEQKLNHLAEKIKEIRRENQFDEIDLKDFKLRLTRLEKELDQSRNLSIQQQSTSFIDKIYLLSSGKTQSRFFRSFV